MSRRQVRQVERQGFALRLHTALDGRTSESFAREINVSLRTVQRWRNGASEPQGQQLAAVCNALGRDVAWFYPDSADIAA